MVKTGNDFYYFFIKMIDFFDMKKFFFFLTLGLMVFAAACADPKLDPFQLAEIKKGNLIALRGVAAENTQDPAFKGACDKFSIANATGESFDFEADYLSDDPSNLSKVIIYAKATETGTRVKVGEIAGNSFAPVAGSRYKRASSTTPLSSILSSIGKVATDFAVDDYIYFESDLELIDGSVVPASSISNSNLFESSLFYPATKLRYIAAM
jgi:hypothetical protein